MVASCEDDTVPNPNPQENPQEPILAQGDIEVAKAGVLNQTGVIDLNDYEGNVELLEVTKATNLPAGASVNLAIQVSASKDFASYKTMNLLANGNVYSYDTFDWNELQLEMFGKSLNPMTVYYRVPVYVNLSSTDYRYNATNYYALEGQMQVKRMNPDYVIEENYYVFGSFVGGNTPASGVKMYHNEEDVYDNPNFSYAFEVSAGQAADGYTLLIAPESLHNAQATSAQCYGVDPDKEGYLMVGGSPLKVTEEGPYMLEFNAQTLEYALKVAPSSLYVMYVGGVFANVSQLSTEDYVTYSGMAGILGAWGLTGQPLYRPTVYIKDPAVAETTAENGTVTGGLMADGSGSPFNNDTGISARAGLFKITANLQTLTYTAYRCATLGVTGDFNGWGETADAQLTSNRAASSDYFQRWTGTFSVEAGQSWKIRANEAWVVNFGPLTADEGYTTGTAIEIAETSNNFKATEAGTYKITIDFKRTLENGKMTPYLMTLEPAAAE